MTDEPKASQGTRSGSAAGRRYTVWRSNLLSDDCSEYDNPDTKALVVFSSDYDALLAEYMSMSQDDGKVERAYDVIKLAHDKQSARIAELEKALRRFMEWHSHPDKATGSAHMMAVIAGTRALADSAPKVADAAGGEHD
jgi:hypothetical protein